MEINVGLGLSCVKVFLAAHYQEAKWRFITRKRGYMFLKILCCLSFSNLLHESNTLGRMQASPIPSQSQWHIDIQYNIVPTVFDGHCNTVVCVNFPAWEKTTHISVVDKAGIYSTSVIFVALHANAWKIHHIKSTSLWKCMLGTNYTIEFSLRQKFVQKQFLLQQPTMYTLQITVNSLKLK